MPGRFQIEAAIPGLHLDRAKTGRVDWLALDKLYYALNEISPSLGASVARAVVLAARHGANAGLAALARLDEKTTGAFQPYWAARDKLLADLGDTAAASGAYAKAISLAVEPPLRRYLETRLDALLRDG